MSSSQDIEGYKNINEIIYQYAVRSIYMILIIIISDILTRIINAIKEFIYFRKHYPANKKWKRILENSFHFNTMTKKFFILFGVILAIEMKQYDKFITYLIDYSHIIPIYIILRLVGLNESTLDVAKWIRLGNGCDYASGMASNYFHGYINLNLPSYTGTKGIRERICDYEDQEQVEFAIKRLFILVSDSLHSQPIFNSEYLEKAKPLETIVQNRAGVARPFRNDVYRFKKKINGKFYYISAEGATPLLSFYDALQSTITNTPQMQALTREILLQFYKSIRRYCFENIPTRNEVEFVYYSDYRVNGKDVDVGQILMQHVKEMLYNNRE